MKSLTELVDEGKLKQIYMIDVDQLNEESKQKIYNYYRGTKNDSYILFTVGVTWMSKEGQVYSAYDFMVPGEVQDNHLHTKVARGLCDYLDIKTSEELKLFSNGILIKYWW